MSTEEQIRKSPQCLTTRSGLGKELCDLLRRELGIPDTVRWFEVRFSYEEPVSVKCHYLPRK